LPGLPICDAVGANVVGDHAPLWIILHRNFSARVKAEAHMLEHTLVEQLRLTPVRMQTKRSPASKRCCARI
jgi:hypothetical protein